MVNFWASWCPPCRDEFPLFKKALATNAGAGLAVVGVVFQNSPDLARAFEARAGATWPSVLDPSGAAASSWRVVVPPQTYFIDRSGTIVSRQIGELTQADLDRQLAAILR